MKKLLVLVALLALTIDASANEVTFIGSNKVVPDAVQKEMIAARINALVQDCTVATKISSNEIQPVKRGLQVKYSTPVVFNAPPAGKVSNITKVVVRLWDNAEESYGMDIYVYNDSDVYLLGKYSHSAYPVIKMILRPIPLNKME